MRPFSLHFGSDTDTPSPTMETFYYLVIIYVIIIILLWILYIKENYIDTDPSTTFFEHSL